MRSTDMAAAATLSLLTSCGGGSPTSATPPTPQQNQARSFKHHQTSPCPCLYLTNAAGGPNGRGSVTVYPVGSTGKVSPIQHLYGGTTKLYYPSGIAVDASGNVYVSNAEAASVTVYAAGATGNVSPTAVISGAKTGLSNPQGIALDPVDDDIYVANFNGVGPGGVGSITIYSPGSHGNVAPIGTISGTSTGIEYPEGLVLDPRGRIYVTNVSGGPSGAGSITIYSAGSHGNVEPTRTISGVNTRMAGPSSLALDSSFNIYAANDEEDAISVFASSASGNVAPIRIIEGRRTKLDNPLGVALDATGNTYAANNSNNSITVYAAGANGNAQKTGIVQGPKTRLDSPKEIAIR